MLSERRFAILIGSSKFQKNSGLLDLRCPENDVDGIKALLSSSEYGNFHKVFDLKNKSSRDVEEKIHEVFSEVDRDDLVLIYYSGHGKQDIEGQLYLATSDTVNKKLIVTAIAIEKILKIIKHSEASKVIIILDCCYSGAVEKALLRGDDINHELKRISLESRGTYVLTASSDIQVAMEKVGDKYGLLTKHIIGGIKGGEAANDEGLISMDSLYRYVYRQVRTEGYQEPMKWELSIKGSDLIIAQIGKKDTKPSVSHNKTGFFLHYQILEQLRRGKGSAIYKVQDTKLGRIVAIKVLITTTATKTMLARLENEAQIGSLLHHPNICTIHDFIDQDENKILIMEYLEGKNVRQLVNGRPLELMSALSIAIQVCDALAYMHSRSIIHRNIKAGNVMISNTGQVTILDFGLARFLEEESLGQLPARNHGEVMEIGVPYGTPTYSAPEQAKGELADHRADIFSTGVLLYEMLTGIWAFQGNTVIDVRHEVLFGTPTPLSAMRSEPLPRQLQHIIDKALAKNPKDRYQKMAAMRDDLRVVLQDISGMPVFQNDNNAHRRPESNPVKRAWNWITGKSSNENLGERAPLVSNSQASAPETKASVADQEVKSIAILPFKNLSQDPNSNFYEFSLADAVITELAQHKSLAVLPSSVIAKYQGTDADPREVGMNMRVSAVLSAGFFRMGEKIRVTAQLLDVKGGGILWSDRIDAHGSDILALQDIIAQRILEGLRLEFSPKEQEVLGTHPTENVEAYEEYLRGRDNFARFIYHTVKMEDCEAAIANFKRAITLDPHFALAYSGLGACYANRLFRGMGSPEDYVYAESAFTKAFFYDPNVVEARTLMVMIYLSRGEKKKARAEIATLQKQFPNDAPLYFVKGTMHRLDGEYEEALKAFEKLARLDPMARVFSCYNRARVFLYQGRHDEAMRELDQGTKIEPNHPLLKIFRASVLYHRGEDEAAIGMIRQVLEQNPEMDGVRLLYAVFLAHQGKQEEARTQLTPEALELAKVDYDMAYWAASTYSQLGEKDLAFKWLECSIKLGNENKQWFETDPTLSNLRSDSRFIALITSIDFTP